MSPAVWLLVMLAMGSARGRRLGGSSRDSEGLDSMSPSRPSYIQCQTSEECAADHCCVLGGERYSIPTCRPMQQVDDACRPSGHKPFNTTVGYPDYSMVELHVYWLFCPCSPGLVCQPGNSSCQAES